MYLKDNLESRSFEYLDVELLPRYFKNVEGVMSDLYPGLKLLIKFNLPHNQNDRSLRPILQQRLKAVSMTS